MSDRQQLTDDDIKVIAEQEISQAIGEDGGQLSHDRAASMDRYLGQPDGKEQEGRSTVQGRDVLDTIEWMLPKLVRMFTNFQSSVEIEPVNADDEEQAAQETDVLNHVFFKKNNGFLILYTWFKDALLQKTGIVKRSVEDFEKKTRHVHESLLDFELAALLSDDENEMIERTDYTVSLPTPNEQGQLIETEVPVSDVTIIHTEKSKRITYEVIPPEDFIISRDAQGPDPAKARMCGHQTTKTASDLIEMGYTQKDIDLMTEGSGINRWTEESIARNHLDDETNYDDVHKLNKAMLTYDVAELYMQIDRNGDGIAELLKIFISGEFIDIEEVDSKPFFTITPVILPHKFNGLSIADLTTDIQEMRTGALRSYFDNFYQTINGTTYYNQNTVNVEDLLVSAPYGIRAVDGPPSQDVMHIQPTGLPAQAYQLLDVIDKLRVERVGDFQSALDPNVLANANNGVVIEMLNESSAKVEMIARIFAETGVRELFRDLHAELIKHGHKEEAIKLRGTWVPIDPQAWQDRTDFTVKVGLGTKNRQEELANLNGILGLQKEFQQMDGGQGQLVTFQNLHSSAKKYIEALGETSPDLFFQDPSKAQPPPPPPEQPDIVGATLQIEQAKIEQKLREAHLKDAQLQRQEQLDREKAQLDAQIMAAKQQVEEVKLQLATIRAESEHMSTQAKLSVMSKSSELNEDLKKMQLVFDQRDQAAKNDLETYKANLSAATNLMTTQMSVAAKATDIKSLDEKVSTDMQAILNKVGDLTNELGGPKEFTRDDAGNVTHVNGKPVTRDNNGNVTGIE